MSRPDFNAAIISDLRGRVIAHNSTHPTQVKLGTLKAVYTAGWNDPHRGRRGRAQSALAKVDSHLNALAKAEEFDPTKHPRDHGKFSSSPGAAAAPAAKPAAIAMRLPVTQADHQQLARDNAGYAAMQSAVVPENRYGAIGGIARDAGALAVGLGYAVSLARGKPNGLAARGLRAAGSATGKIAASVGSGIANYLRVASTDAFLNATGRNTAAGRAIRLAAARNRARAATLAGADKGRKAGDLAFRAQRGVVRRLAEAAGNGGSTPRAVKARRGTAVAMIGLAPAYAIRSAVQGTAFDPQAIGEKYDAVSYRQIQKVMQSDALGTAQTAMLDVLNKGGDFGDLRKAIPDLPVITNLVAHAYSGAGKVLLSGAAAVAGAFSGGAIGAGAGHLASGKGGNPNHDAKGRFASSPGSHTGLGAAIGAGLGAAGAGVGIYAALRSHNFAALRATAEARKTAMDAVLASINSAAGIDPVAGRVLNRKVAVQATVDEAARLHPDIIQAEAAHAAFGAANPLHFKDAIATAVNTHIGNMAAFQSAFQIKTANGEWKTLAGVEPGLSNTSYGRAAASRAVRDFVAKLPDDAAAPGGDFARAIEHLTPEQQATHLQWFNDRAKLVDGVDAQLASQHGKITAAETKVAAAKDVWEKLQTDAIATKAVADRGGTLEEITAAGEAHTAAELAVSKASDKYDAATRALTKAKASTGEVIMPLGLPGGGKPVPAPTALDSQNVLAALHTKIRGELTAKHEVAYDAETEAVRNSQRQEVAEQSNCNLAALAVLGGKFGTPKNAHAAMKAAVAAHEAFNTVDAALTAAKQKVAVLSKAMEELGGLKRPPHAAKEAEIRLNEAAAAGRVDSARTALQAAQTAFNGAPDGEKAAASAALRNARTAFTSASKAHAPLAKQALHFDIVNAGAEVNRLTADRAIARATRATAAADFSDALATPAPRRKYQILPDGLMADLKADLHEAKGSMSASTRAIFDHPTMQKLKTFADKKYADAKAGAIDGAHTLFFRKEADGSHKLVWGKVLTRGPIVATVAGSSAAGAKEFYDYAKAKTFGTDEEKANAKLPKLPFDLDRDINGITGANYAALTIAHPTEKGERIILYGERSDNLDETPKQLVPGGRISSVKAMFQNGKWNIPGENKGGGQSGQVHTGPIEGFNDQKAVGRIKDALTKLQASNSLITDDIDGGNGTRMRYVANGTDVHGADKLVTNQMKYAFLDSGKGGAARDPFFAGLKALFSYQAQVLSPQKRYAMLTNRDMSGNLAGYDHGIFANSATSDGFNASDKASIVKALSGAVDLALKLNPSRDDAANLHRAVHVVGLARDIPVASLAPIQASIGKSYAGQPQPQQQNQQQGQQRQGQQQGQQRQGQQQTRQYTPGTAVVSTLRSRSTDVPPEPRVPTNWDKAELDAAALTAAVGLRRASGGPYPYDASDDAMATALKFLALHAQTDHPELSLEEAVDAAKNAVTARVKATGRDHMHANISNGDYESHDQDLFDELNTQAWKIKTSNKLDSLEDLMKAFGGGAFDSAKHPRDPAGQHGGGEFAAGNGSAAQPPAAAGYASPTPAPAAAAGAATHPRQPKQPGSDADSGATSLSELHPVRAIPDLASAAGMQAAWMTAEHYTKGFGAKAGAGVAGKIAGAYPDLHVARQARLFPKLAMKAAEAGLKAQKIAAKFPGAGKIDLGMRAGADAAAATAKQTAADAGVHATARAAAAAAGDVGETGFGASAKAAAFSIAERFLPKAATAAVGAATLAGKFLASGVGAVVANTVATAAVDGAYHLAGSKAPVNAEANEPTGRMLAGIAGNIVGGLAGGAAGGLATAGLGGEFAGSVAGQWAGGVAGDRLYDWFEGYPQAHKQRALKNFMSPQAVSA
jgi:hypothetical protein